MAYRDDDDKERDGNVAEESLDEVLDETDTEDEDDALDTGLLDDEKGWE